MNHHKGINVYIATLPRSGSTMLGMMLGNHPDIFHMGESSYWGKLNPKDIKCSCGVVGCNILSAVHESILDSQDVFSIYDVCRIIDKIEEPNKAYHSLSLGGNYSAGNILEDELRAKILSSCEGLDQLADSFRKIISKKNIIDNTKCIDIAEYLSEEKWKIILLTRDPRGLAYSNKKSGIRKNVPRSLKSKIPVYVNFAKKAKNLVIRENVIHVRYEDLCLETSDTLRSISDFIGVNFEKNMLNFKTDKGHALMGNRMRFDDNQEVREDLEWITGLSAEEQQAITSNKELTDLFRYFNYFIK